MKSKEPTRASPDFPLFPHASGRWAEETKGKTVYFGPWDDADGALARYRGQNPTPIKIPVSVKSAKPSKPHPDYPLYAHASGRWAKRVRNKVHYFGPWDDPEKRHRYSPADLRTDASAG